MLKYGSHFVNARSQVSVLLLYAGELVMQDGDLYTFGVILSFEALGVFVEKFDSLLIFVKIHVNNNTQ